VGLDKDRQVAISTEEKENEVDLKDAERLFDDDPGYPDGVRAIYRAVRGAMKSVVSVVEVPRDDGTSQKFVWVHCIDKRMRLVHMFRASNGTKKATIYDSRCGDDEAKAIDQLARNMAMKHKGEDVDVSPPLEYATLEDVYEELTKRYFTVVLCTEEQFRGEETRGEKKMKPPRVQWSGGSVAALLGCAEVIKLTLTSCALQGGFAQGDPDENR